MKMTKLLTGAAALALLTGAANAQIVIQDVDAAATAQDFVAAGHEFATEVDLDATGVTGNLEFAIDASGLGTAGAPLFDTLSSTDTVTITVNLTGALSFAATVVGADSVGTCVLDVTSGGAIGSQTVVFTTTTDPTACDADDTNLAFDLDIDVDGAGNLAVDIASDGSSLYSETYDADADFTGTQELVTTAAGLEVTTTDGSVEINSATSGTTGLSSVNLAVAATGSTFTVTETGADVDFATDLTLAAALDTADFTVTFADPSGFAGAAIDTNALTFDADDNPDFVTIDETTVNAAAILLGVDVALTEDGDDEEVIARQDVTFAGAFVGATNYDLSALDFSYTAYSLVGDYTAADTGADQTWVGGSSSVTNTVWRCTGIEDATEGFATLSNTSGGTDGLYSLGTLTATDGEVIITNDQIATASGDFTRADVELSFNQASGIDCEALLVGSNGTLTR